MNDISGTGDEREKALNDALIDRKDFGKDQSCV